MATNLPSKSALKNVTLPHYIGSERVSSFIKRHGLNAEALAEYRDKHLITIGRQALKG
jgi:hypothetical protein